MPLEPQKAPLELLDMYYHDMRSHLLEVAAAFDRIERGGPCSDSRFDVLRRAAAIAVDAEQNRAVRFLQALSE